MQKLHSSQISPGQLDWAACKCRLSEMAARSNLELCLCDMHVLKPYSRSCW